MGHEERKIDKKVLDGVRDRDGGIEAGKDKARERGSEGGSGVGKED